MAIGPAEFVVIINASSGMGASTDLRTRLEERFASAGASARIVLVPQGGDASAAARHAVADKPRFLVAGGGDGTINTVASALVGTGTALGVLPLGTLNHFAKALGIPPDLDAAVDVLLGRRVKNVDVGDVNGRIFLNNSSLGLYPKLVHSRQEQQKLGRGKWPAFAWALFSVLRRHPFVEIRVEVEGTTINRRVPFVFIGNNEYQMEGLHLGERDRLNSGRLGLYVPRIAGRLGLLGLALAALFHRLRQARNLDAMSVTAFDIDSRHSPLRVAIDGEVIRLDLPLHYRVRPLALEVLA